MSDWYTKTGNPSTRASGLSAVIRAEFALIETALGKLPTYTSNAILFRLALNQRASHSLVLDPDGAIHAPATANNGLGLYPTHASSTVLCSAKMHFHE